MSKQALIILQRASAALLALQEASAFHVCTQCRRWACASAVIESRTGHCNSHCLRKCSGSGHSPGSGSFSGCKRPSTGRSRGPGSREPTAAFRGQCVIGQLTHGRPCQLPAHQTQARPAHTPVALCAPLLHTGAEASSSARRACCDSGRGCSTGHGSTRLCCPAQQRVGHQQRNRLW